jgi:DNA-binding response OmpR family regulator
MTKILIVDDAPDMAKLMARTVERQGYESVTAHDGPQALQRASAEHPAVILLDVMMPGMNGLEVLRRLKQDAELRMIPVILVTANGDDGDVIEGLNAGAHDYVAKPFKREILGARVRAAVHVRENHDQLRQVNGRLEAEIAERKRMEQELAHAQKLEVIGQLAAGIAHEINTPAQYVGDNTRFLRDAFGEVDKLLDTLGRLLQAAQLGGPTDELVAELDAAVRSTDMDYLRQEVPAAIQQSLEGIERVADIVNAMKDFSRPADGQKQPLDLNRAIEKGTRLVHRPCHRGTETRRDDWLRDRRRAGNEVHRPAAHPPP